MPIGRTMSRFGRRPMPVGFGRSLWDPLLEGAALFADFEAFDPATLTLVSGKVSSWANKGSAGSSASQATDADRLAYSATGLNGRPAIGQAGSFGKMALTGTSGLPTGTDTITIVLAAMATSGSNNGKFINYSSAAGGGGTQRFIANTPNSSTPYPLIGTNGSGGLSATDVPWGNGAIIVAEYKTGSQTQFLNGELTGRSTTMQYAALSGTNIFQIFDGFIAGWVAATYGYAGQLSTAQRQRFEGYLAPIVGVTLPTGHPWRDGPPTA